MVIPFALKLNALFWEDRLQLIAIGPRFQTKHWKKHKKGDICKEKPLTDREEKEVQSLIIKKCGFKKAY